VRGEPRYLVFYDYWISCDGATGGETMAGGVLAEGFGPGAIAVAIFELAVDAELTAFGALLLQRPEVGQEFRVGRNA
jgi:hypothetical protein